MPGRLEGKVCVITGAASGIGAETAKLFADEGAHVVGVDLKADSKTELALACDVADDAQVRKMFNAAHEEFGRIDVLFNNAGIVREDDRSVLNTSMKAWHGSRTSISSRSSSAANTASPTCSSPAADR